MLLNSELYYAKLLLFGEFSVILGSKALTVPYGHFKGELSFPGDYKVTDQDYALASNRMLRQYLKTIGHKDKANPVSGIIDTVRFEKDIENGLFFESTIPQGYGLGSSGALSAAIYGRYAFHRIRQSRNLSSEDLSVLRAHLAIIEKQFHGTSSGIDPLSCYVRFPLFISSQNEMNLVSVPRNRDFGGAGIFLLDTGIHRKTGPYVRKFIDYCKNERFSAMIYGEYIPINNSCIDSIIAGDIQSFKESLRILSQLQYDYLKSMIPSEMQPLWKEGIDSRSYYLKLCGAGGGGYILGFAKDMEMVRKNMKKNGHSVIVVFSKQFKL